MAKTATKRKAPGQRNRTPKLASGNVLNTRTPLTTEAAGKMVTAFETFLDKKFEWTEKVRKHFADGGTKANVPAFTTSAFPDPNKGIMSRTAYDKLLDQLADEVKGVNDLPRYQPIQVELARETNCSVLRRGTSKTQGSKPANWDEKAHGKWEIEDEDGNFTIPSGLHIDSTPPRLCHATSAEAMLTDAEASIVELGTNRFVVGTGTSLNASAVMAIRIQTGGNYLACDLARRRMSLAGNSDVPFVVFRIEDKANNGDGVTVKGAWSPAINEMVFRKGQAMTPGYLMKGTKRLDSKAIRALENMKGVKFEALKDPIIGKAISWERLWKEIQVIGKESLTSMRKREGRSEDFEKGNTQDCSITNIGTTCRISPTEANPFGLQAGQAGMVPYRVAAAEGGLKALSHGTVIGARGSAEFNVSVSEAKALVAPAKPEPKKAEPKKAPAKKAVKKATAKKATKPAADAKTEAAAPITGDTADTGAGVGGLTGVS